MPPLGDYGVAGGGVPAHRNLTLNVLGVQESGALTQAQLWGPSATESKEEQGLPPLSNPSTASGLAPLEMSPSAERVLGGQRVWGRCPACLPVCLPPLFLLFFSPPALRVSLAPQTSRLAAT